MAPTIDGRPPTTRHRFPMVSRPGVGSRSHGPSPVFTAGLLLAAALIAWVVTIERMRGMDAGPGTDLGGLGWFIGVWVTMMAAMMLPAAAPMGLVVRRVSA